MDAERHDAVTGSAGPIDREIRAALAVEPSHAFVARVRTRIASEPRRAGWWISRPALWGGAALLAALVALAVLMSRPVNVDRGHTIAKADIPLEAPAPTVVSSQAPSAATKAAAQTVNRRRVASGGQQTPAPQAPPDILVDPREAAALRAVIAGARAGVIDLEPVLRASAPSSVELPAIASIAIAPLTIDPLEEGVRQ